jgi:hypothetical protein
MYQPLLIIHSLLRYAVLFAALYAIYRAVVGWQKNLPYTSDDNKASVFLIIFVHTQLLLGLVLYFWLSPWASASFDMKDPVVRFWKVEHLSTMLIAIALFQFGRIVSKKSATDLLKHKKAAIFYIIAFVILMAGIPWPFMKTVGRNLLPF